MAITLTGLGQQMPYNPDANGDDFVGVDDVLGVLGEYDTALMQPDLTCDYEGTDLEQLFGGLIAGNLILDSVYVEYLLIDSALTYLPECPDPVVIETVLERSFILEEVDTFLDIQNPVVRSTGYPLGYYRAFKLQYYSQLGEFILELSDQEVEFMTYFPQSSQWDEFLDMCCLTGVSLPFPSYWELNDDGVQVDWESTDWAGNCESLRIIPFWHEAE